MTSLRSTTVPTYLLGAMRQHACGLHHADPARGRAAEALPDAPASAPGTLPPQDWAALFGAVTERLQQLAGSGPTAPDPGPGLRLQECVDALRQLHQGLDARLQGSTHLLADLAAARAQLAGTRTALAHTHIGRRRAERASLHDALTRLPNRTHLHARLEGRVGAARGGDAALAVFYVDLDGFKQINDAYGRDAGDATLCIVAQRLTRALRAQDTVCRLGGDEFACLLVAPVGREQLARLACKLYDAVAAPLQLGARSFSVQPSIGIAVCPGDGASAATLLQRADAAMYSAKRHQQGYAFAEGCDAP